MKKRERTQTQLILTKAKIKTDEFSIPILTRNILSAWTVFVSPLWIYLRSKCFPFSITDIFRHMPKLNMLDLFCGAGGFGAGFVQTGFQVLGAVELLDVYCKTHKLNFPNSRVIQADISLLSPAQFASQTKIRKKDIRIIVGSPPCQTFSTIGIPKIASVKGANIKTDPRNYLFKSYFDYVAYYQPDIFLLENVPAMMTRFDGTLFERMLEMIADLGYEPQHTILNAAEHGVPQTRKRLIVAGTKSGIRFSFPSKIKSLPANGAIRKEDLLPGLETALPPATTVREAISDLPAVWDGCRIDEMPYSTNTNLSSYQVRLRNGSKKVRNNICRMSNDRAKKVFKFMPQGGKYADLPSEVKKVLPFREDIFLDRLKRLDMNKPSWTVLAHIGMDGYMYIHPTENRTLSVREAARLQSFPDHFVFVGNMREQYIQVGNAVPPMLAEELAKAVKKALP
jgi:DNA (cytosine-5)-methyltransferase 1